MPGVVIFPIPLLPITFRLRKGAGQLVSVKKHPKTRFAFRSVVIMNPDRLAVLLQGERGFGLNPLHFICKERSAAKRDGNCSDAKQCLADKPQIFKL